MMETAGDTLEPLQGTVADGLLVNLGSNNDVSVSSSALPSGAATSAKQLADGHNVTIDNVDGAEVKQGTAADLKATVTQADSARTITGNVNVTQASTARTVKCHIGFCNFR